MTTKKGETGGVKSLKILILFILLIAFSSPLSAAVPAEIISSDQSVMPQSNFTPGQSAPAPVPQGPVGQPVDTTGFFAGGDTGISLPGDEKEEPPVSPIQTEPVSDRDGDGTPDAVEMFFRTNPQDSQSYPNKEEIDHIDGFKPMPYPVSQVQSSDSPLVPGHSNCIGMTLWYLKEISVPANIPDIKNIYQMMQRRGYSRGFDLQRAMMNDTGRFRGALVVWDGHLSNGSRFYHVGVVVSAQAVQTQYGRDVEVTILEQPGTGNPVGTSTVKISQLKNHFTHLDSAPQPSIYFPSRSFFQRRSW